MLTIKSKIILASTVVFGLTLASFAVLVFHITKESELAKLDARLKSHSDKLATEIEEQLDEGLFPDLADFGDVVTDGLPVAYMQVWDSVGQLVIADSNLGRLDWNSWESQFLKDTVTQTFQAENAEYLCQWFPVEIDERVPVVLQVVVPLSDVQASLGRLRTVFLVTIPIALVLTGAAAFFITRAAFRPLSSMANAAKSISASSLERRLDVPRAGDEVRTLAETLNGMFERIESAFHSQRQFVADASHEFRTPLTVLRSELEYAQRVEDPASVRESIAVSLGEIDRLILMVDDLLLLARLDAAQAVPDFKTLRIDELVVETVRLIKRLATSKGITLELYVQDAIEISANESMLKRAIINILHNAIKFSPSDATVLIRLYSDGTRPNSVLLAIQDNGPGITSADQTQVFERFYRSPESRAEGVGSGLGLSIAKTLIELNGGEITLHSEIEKGTSILIGLPKLPQD